MAYSGFALIQESLVEVASGWREAGSQLCFDVTANYGLCAVDGCHGMAFVGLRTEVGQRPVCLKHYRAIELTRAS